MKSWKGPLTCEDAHYIPSSRAVPAPRHATPISARLHAEDPFQRVGLAPGNTAAGPAVLSSWTHAQASSLGVLTSYHSEAPLSTQAMTQIQPGRAIVGGVLRLCRRPACLRSPPVSPVPPTCGAWSQPDAQVSSSHSRETAPRVSTSTDLPPPTTFPLQSVN